MLDKLNQLFKHTIIYGIGQMGSRIAAVLLIPLYTIYLTPSDYGVLQIARVINSFLLALILLGMSTSMFRVYYKTDDQNEKQLIINSTVITYFVISAFFFTPLILILSSYSDIIIAAPESRLIMILVFISVFLEGLFTLQLAVLRAEERSKTYSTISIIKTLLYIGITILFLTYFQKKYIGILQAGIISLIIIDLIMIPISFSGFRFQISIKHIKEILQIGIPLAIAGIGVWILNLSDRYMLQMLMPEETALDKVGIYSLGDKLSLFIKFFLIFPFMLTWGSMMYKYAEKTNSGKIYSTVFKIFIYVAVLAAFFLSSFGKELVQILARNPEFYPAYKVVPLLSYSKVLSGIIFVISVGVILPKKSQFIALTSFIAASLNIALNFFLIPKFGIVGASGASLIAYLINVCILFLIAQKFHHIPYKILPVILFFCFYLLVSIAMIYFNLNLLYKSLIFTGLIFLSPFLGLVRYNNILLGLNYLRKKEVV